MLNPRTNRRPMTRLVRFWSLGVLVPASILVASLQVVAQTARIDGKVVDQAGNAVRNPSITFTISATWQQARPMRYTFFDQAGNVVQNPDITFSTGRSASARLIGQDDGSFEIFDLEPGEYSLAVSTPGFEPLFRRFSLEAGEQREEELVLSRIQASRQPRTGTEWATRLPESIGSAVEQEPSTEPSSERIVELVERAAALQEQLQTVLDELRTVLNDPDRSNEPIRIGNGIPPPAKIHDVPPVYPPAARTAGVQGLRANGIPAGLCYQRLVMDRETNRFMLHGLNAVLLPEFGWHRIDPRGNKPGVDAQFDPPNERLAWPVTVEGEGHLRDVWADPLPSVVAVLREYDTWEGVQDHLPDIPSRQIEFIADGLSRTDP